MRMNFLESLMNLTKSWLLNNLMQDLECHLTFPTHNKPQDRLIQLKQTPMKLML